MSFPKFQFGDLVEVYWHDHCGYGGWCREAEAIQEERLRLIHSFGHFLSCNDQILRLAQSMDDQKPPKTNDRLVIAVNQITKIRKVPL